MSGGQDRGVLARVPQIAQSSRPARRPAVRLRLPESRTPSHEGLRAAIGQVLGCPWQRCSVHFLRNMLGHCAKSQQPMIAAATRGIFAADNGQQARERLAEVVERLQPLAPKVAQLLLDAEDDLLGFYAFPREHWSKLRSTNPLERVNREIGRRTDVVGIFPNHASLIRLAGMLLIEQSDEWLVSRRYLSQESLAAVPDAAEDTDNKIKEVAALSAA